MDLPPIPDAERTPLVESLLGIIDLLHRWASIPSKKLSNNSAMKSPCSKRQSPRPKIAPSQPDPTDPATEPPQTRSQTRIGQTRQERASFLTAFEVRIPFPTGSPGAVSNGYEEYVVQELLLEAKVTRYWRERIVLADGSSRLAPLPEDVLPGLHFGPGLLAFVLYQHNQCNGDAGQAARTTARTGHRPVGRPPEPPADGQPRGVLPREGRGAAGRFANRRTMSGWTIPEHATRARTATARPSATICSPILRAPTAKAD